MNIVFMGTPDFAVPCLEALVEKGHNVTAVFAQPDRPKGRGHKLCPPPVKQCAEKYGIPIFQPEKIKNNAEVTDLLQRQSPDVIVVVAYGKILPKSILDIPKFGCVNIHASLLPKYRGSAPIQWAVINGEKVTGVTAMLLDEGMDTGDMLLREQCEIPENMTGGELFDLLAPMGAKVLTDTLDSLECGLIFPEKQNESEATYAPMLKKEDAAVDFSLPAEGIINLVRGLNPWPVAYTFAKDMKIKIYEAKLCGETDKPFGTLIDDKNFVVACGDKRSVELCSVQIAGSRVMSGRELLRGHPLQKGTVFKKSEE